MRTIVDDCLDDYETVYKIPLAQADIVRLGTVWLGQQRIGGFWEQYSKPYERSVVFDFDLFDIPPTSMEFSEKDSSTDYYQIPQFSYPLAFGTKSKINTRLRNTKNLSEEEQKDLKRQAAYLGQMPKSKLTKLISTDECTVLIPSIEFLTSCYTPREQHLRNKIVNLKLDEALADYIDIKESGENDLGEYDLYMKSRKHQTNLAFLGYAHSNAVTKKSKNIVIDFNNITLVISFQTRNASFVIEFKNITPIHKHLFRQLVDLSKEIKHQRATF